MDLRTPCELSRRGRIAICLGLVHFLVACASMPILPEHVQSSVLSPLLIRQGSSTPSPIGITDRFSLQGYVYSFTVLSWPEPGRKAGYHSCFYRWYKNGDLFEETRRRSVPSSKPPIYLWAWQLAIGLGEGQHAVELYVDDKMIVRREFSVGDSTLPPEPQKTFQPIHSLPGSF